MNSTLVHTTSTDAHRRHVTATAGITRVHAAPTRPAPNPAQACIHPRELIVTGDAGNRQCVECGTTLPTTTG